MSTGQIVHMGIRIYLGTLGFILCHKAQGMSSAHYELQLRIIGDQILILLRRSEFPLPTAIGTVKPWILREFTFAFSYGHYHPSYAKNHGGFFPCNRAVRQYIKLPHPATLY